MTVWGIFQLVFLLVTFITGVYYAHTHYANVEAWKKLSKTNQTQSLNNSDEAPIFFSILIAARNEAANIENCLTSIFQQDYPHAAFEVILIDDHSTDATASIASDNFGDRLHLIRQVEEDVHGKKAAIARGIKAAKGDWIVTTDADCEVPKTWLKNLAHKAKSANTVFVGGPVLFKAGKGSILHKFQRLDLIGMMGVTAGGIQRGAAYLANGANLTYAKSAFNQVEGFKGVDKKASGDDMLLLQKLAGKFPQGIAYANQQNNIVLTTPETSWGDFYRQRLRWASKGNSFPNFATWFQMVLVFIFCLCLLGSIVLAFYDPLFFGPLALAILIFKFIADFFYLRYLSNYFKQEKLIGSIWWATLVHALYIVVIGTAAQFVKKYEWKGRRVR